MPTFNSIIACLVCAVIGSSFTILYSLQMKIQRNRSIVSNNQRQRQEQNIGVKYGETSKLNQNQRVSLVILKDAVKEGAVCLDGSPPAYIWKKGHGDGIDKWIVYFNGGAWCYDQEACYQRSFTPLGSTKYQLGKAHPNTGMYSSNKTINPDFHNWNMIFVMYCDGSSFTGMRTNPVYLNGNAVYFRGKLILNHIIKNLLERGLHNSQQVILTGSSAGSLAVLFHADYIKSQLSPSTEVYAISDSGYFVDLKTFYGDFKFRARFTNVMNTHNSTAALHPACIKQTHLKEYWKCMFPQYFVHFIRTPVFILQSAYDVWQIINGLSLGCKIPDYDILSGRKKLPDLTSTQDSRDADIPATRKSAQIVNNEKCSLSRVGKTSPVKPVPFEWHWQNLYSGPPECTKPEIEKILNVYQITIEALAPVMRKDGAGLFLSPCFEHSQARYELLWTKVKVRGKTMRQVISEWIKKTSENNFYIGEYRSFDTCVS